MPKIRNADHATGGVSEGISKSSMRNLSGYRLFAKENRSAVQSEKQGSRPQEIMREMGHTWSNSKLLKSKPEFIDALVEENREISTTQSYSALVSTDVCYFRFTQTGNQ
ncbi:hypothetical protein DdX_03198 [Ditylenchus destructor]|uniref:HMG box domain-containing protein n=1 Tax=Ditylenchus destructor TaxID=166010 RepID=A0AAD4NG67_9BILA|nr:hypothetical protein DdX_03198 [Ditylenchus destructor]